jgi:hypothetical protein
MSAYCFLHQPGCITSQRPVLPILLSHQVQPQHRPDQLLSSRKRLRRYAYHARGRF